MTKSPIRSISTIIPNIISGKEVLTTENQIPVASPNNRDILYNYSHFPITPKSISELSTASYSGFKSWSTTSESERTKIFSRVIELLQQRRHEIIESQQEIGMPLWFAGFNIDGLISQIEQYIKVGSSSNSTIVPSNDTDLAMTVRTPIGPVLSISPWNAPILLAGRSIVAPLAAGCSVIVKPSEKSPKCAYLLVKCFLDAGVPANALQLVNVQPQDNPEFLDKLLGSGKIRKLNFTGSTNVGKKIATVAGSHLIPCLLELGGKNSSIVCQDADIDQAVGKITWSGWAHKGQICMSTDVVYIHESIYDEFKSKLVNVATEIAQDPDYLLPQRDSIGTNKVTSLIDDALTKGASIVFGKFSQAEIESSNIIKPLILENVTSDMDLYHQESFGPIFSIEKFSNIDEIIDKVNANEYGLKCSIWSRNTLQAIKLAEKVESGGVHINNPTVHDEPTVPHGGVKSSGIGRFNSNWGIEEFTVVKAITVNE
ncbi:Salicylaldehyde dehydrogenase [Spathaspora sp. JA1]|nr:Salicylaldehyde dehydrogenase [Spathaspora sp. JA1]